MGFGAQKTISSYSFDRIVLIFGYIVESTNTKILSTHFFAISILNPNFDVINDVISGFAKVVVERCGFHHWIAQRISCDEVVSVFLYLIVSELWRHQWRHHDVTSRFAKVVAERCGLHRRPWTIVAWPLVIAILTFYWHKPRSIGEHLAVTAVCVCVCLLQLHRDALTLDLVQ